MTSRATRLRRNLRLLVGSATQHLVDDPTLLVIQVSRRLPLGVRRRTGRVIVAAARRVPHGHGIAALGAYMAGDVEESHRRLDEGRDGSSRLLGEVALLVGRPELIPADASPTLRARAAWSRGDLSAAVRILEDARRGEGLYARRLRSELALLEPGHRLRTPPTSDRHAVPSPRADASRRRVLHLVTNSLPHTQSGYSLRTHRLLTALRELGTASVALTRTGYPVLVGTVRASERDDLDGVSYVRTLPRSLGVLPEQRLDQQVDAAMRIVETFRPHVLHATTDYRNALVAEAVSRATGIPWVFEVRGFSEQTWAASRGDLEARRLAGASERTRSIVARESELARAAAAVVTLSRTMAHELTRRGVDPAGVTLVPNGVEAELLESRRTPEEARLDLARSWDLPSGAFVVGSASALVDYEGFDVLLRAVALLVRDGESVALRDSLHVVLVGDGTAAPGIVALATGLGIADRVHLPGRVPSTTAPLWVQAMDVVVVPRLDREVTRMVTPQKPVEAMALGRPVVVSDLPALRETITDESGVLCGELAAAGDAAELATRIAELTGDPARRTELAARGRALATRRTWQEMARRVDRVHEQVLLAGSGGVRHGR